MIRQAAAWPDRLLFCIRNAGAKMLLQNWQRPNPAKVPVVCDESVRADRHGAGDLDSVCGPKPEGGPEASRAFRNVRIQIHDLP